MSKTKLYEKLAAMTTEERSNSIEWLDLSFFEKMTFLWIHKNIVIIGGIILVIAAPFAFGDLTSKVNDYIEKFNGAKNQATSINSSLKSNDIKIIPAAIIINEYNKNKLRAKEKYGHTAYKLVAVFHQVQNDKYSNGNGILITMVESWEGGLMYAVLPQSQRANLINLDNGSLVSINCIELDEYSSSPIFKKCDFIEKIDTKGERPKIYLDKLVWENNELVNPRK
jgi:hypothetical protein